MSAVSADKGSLDAAEEIRKANAESLANSQAINAANREGDRQKEQVAAIGNSQKSAHDALMAVIGNIK